MERDSARHPSDTESRRLYNKLVVNETAFLCVIIKLCHSGKPALPHGKRMIPKTVRRLRAFPECLRGAGETQREGACFEGVLQCVRAASLPAFRAVREPDEFPDFPEFDSFRSDCLFTFHSGHDIIYPS